MLRRAVALAAITAGYAALAAIATHPAAAQPPARTLAQRDSSGVPDSLGLGDRDRGARDTVTRGDTTGRAYGRRNSVPRDRASGRRDSTIRSRRGGAPRDSLQRGRDRGRGHAYGRRDSTGNPDTLGSSRRRTPGRDRDSLWREPSPPDSTQPRSRPGRIGRGTGAR